MRATADQDCTVRIGGTTVDDHRTALRFVLGLRGWRVEARVTAHGGAHLWLTTAAPETGAARCWRVDRCREGLLVSDGASGHELWAVPTMRDALVKIWEAVADAARD